MVAKSDEIRIKIRACVEAANDVGQAKEALANMGVRVLSIHVHARHPDVEGIGIQLKSGGQIVSLLAEAFVPEEFIADAGASGLVPAGWKKFSF